MNPFRLCFLFTLCTLALGGAAVASAQQLEVCPAAQPCSVPRPATVGRETTLPIVWHGRGLFDGVADAVSDAGFFVLGDTLAGEQLGLVREPLMEQIRGTTDGRPVQFSFRETLTVPAEVSRRAADRGAKRLFYIRQFSIQGIAVTGVQAIRLSAPLPSAAPSLPEGGEVTASGLIVRRLALRFEDGAAVASAARGEQLRARAAVRYERAGLLEAVWEVATPATTRGQPVFRRLDNLRRYLGAGREATLESPLLPTSEEGLHLLRLRLLQPAFERDAIELRYRVGGAPAATALVPVLRASQPQPGETLGAGTEFRWRPLAGTRAYQLELYDRPPSTSQAAGPDRVPAEMDSAPATGLLLDGNTARSRLSASVLHRLQPGRIYYWRVSAIDTDGAIVAASPLQSIRTED